jgi:hypothetical protein
MNTMYRDHPMSAGTRRPIFASVQQMSCERGAVISAGVSISVKYASISFQYFPIAMDTDTLCQRAAA